MRLVNSPTKWVVHLHDGSTVMVFADSAEGLAGPDDHRDYHFVNLMDIPVEQQGDFDVVNAAPSNPERVVVTVAIFPRASVARVT